MNSEDETREILSDQVFTDCLRESTQQAKGGKTLSIEAVVERLRVGGEPEGRPTSEPHA